MNKRVFIVSIFLLIILVLVTYASAIGIRSKESSTKQSVGSPLFTIRINNAINTDTPKLISNYIGKGENTLSFFPMRQFIKKTYDTNVFRTNAPYCAASSGCSTVDVEGCPTFDLWCGFISEITLCDYLTFITICHCGPTDNGPFCGFTENGPICDINLFNDEQAFPLLQ